MKSIRLIAKVTSTLGLVAAMNGCGSDSSGGGASCASVCSRVEAAHCANDPDCTTQCTKAKEATPSGCTASYNALAKCFSTATFTCDADETSVAAACKSQQDAWQTCVDNGGAADSGAGGSGTGGSGAGGSGSSAMCNGATATDPCSACLAKSCCTELTSCAKDQNCTTLAKCADNCTDDACIQSCADAASQAAINSYNDTLTCVSDKCTSACEGDAGTGGSGQSGVGAPNDGNEGVASATTPAGCLDVPSDVTGYCGDVKYKIIYDCPNGAPYPDCVPNTMGSSGIYCCGH